jgi:hypothetical protein
MNKTEFDAELRRLVDAHQRAQDNVGCVECASCEGCRDCTFCKNGKRLTRCHYCVDCERCSASTHCRQSRDLLSCNHCDRCERCSQSSYLVQCFDCTGCTYCFGCVGLVGKEFHVLNQPMTRSEYFATIAKLGKPTGGAPETGAWRTAGDR